MTDSIRIDGLPTTVLPTLEHVFAAMKSGQTVQLSVQQISNLIVAQITDNSPETLDTLNELAAALGDDPNFSTTILSTIAAMQSNIIKWNYVINGDFRINLRGGAKIQSVGIYGYDRWKGHANGLEQVVEALPAGEYTLTWTSGGTGTFNGTTAVSPIVSTVTAGNKSVIVPTSAINVSLTSGDNSSSNPYKQRVIQLEYLLASWYCQKLVVEWFGVSPAAGHAQTVSQNIQRMRSGSGYSVQVLAITNSARWPSSAQSYSKSADGITVVRYPTSSGGNETWKSTLLLVDEL